MLDAQTKRGVLEICILAALRRGDSYGYELIRTLSACVTVSESTLYPILRRLEASKLLTVRSAEHNGRLRKYYHITPQGLQRLDTFKKDWNELLGIYQYIVREDDGHE